MVLLAPIGFLLSWRAWGRRGLPVNALALAVWLAISLQAQRAGRQWLPAAPIVAMWAALALVHLSRWLARRAERLPASMARKAPALLLLGWLLVASVGYDLRFQATDVRTLAQQWVGAHVEEGAPVAIDYFGPNLDPQRWPVTTLFRLSDHPLSWYQEQGIRYLLFHEVMYGPDSNAPPDVQAQYEALTDRACLQERVTGPFLSNADMTIAVYRVPPCE